MKVWNVRHLEALFDRGTVAGMPDELLLERFAVDRDGPAFEAIVARHGPMVFNVCRRSSSQPERRRRRVSGDIPDPRAESGSDP